MLFCIIFLFFIITNTIVIANIFHMKVCHMPECPKCMLIGNSINFFENINYIIQYLVIVNAIISLIYIIKTILNINMQNTLVKLNVILNE